jgi:hypothetical protein
MKRRNNPAAGVYGGLTPHFLNGLGRPWKSSGCVVSLNAVSLNAMAGVTTQKSLPVSLAY